MMESEVGLQRCNGLLRDHRMPTGYAADHLFLTMKGRDAYVCLNRRGVLLAAVVLGLAFIGITPAEAQVLTYPLDTKPAVSATFGTYRIGHHHAGLDLITGGDDTVAVLSAAPGHVIRIRRNHTGFGRAVYLAHGDGRVTVYAHLSAFGPTLAPLVAAAEAKTEGFRFDYRPRRKIKVDGGAPLGWVGTSGTDLVHLHFELRIDGTPVNPLTNGLFLPDSRSPVVRTILAIPYGADSHVNDAHDELFVSLDPAKAGAGAPSIPTLSVGGRVGLFVEAVDFIDGHARALTPYGVALRIDGKPWHEVRYDTSSYVGRGRTELDYHPRLRSRGKGMYHRLFGEGVRLAQHRRVGATLQGLEPGKHSGEIEVVDAAGRKTVQPFELEVRPNRAPCTLTRGKLAKGPATKTPITPLLRRRTLVMPTPALCAPGSEVAVRLNGRLHRTFSVTKLDGTPAVAVDVSATEDARVSVGLRRAHETRWIEARTYATPAEKPRLLGPARIKVKKDARFFPYPTFVWTEENPGAPGLSVVSPIHRFANAYAPSKGGMAVALLRPKEGDHRGVGIYLEEAGRWWYSGGKRDGAYITGHTVHPVGLALMRDETPPTVGSPTVRAHPSGHRLFVPIHDEGAGIRVVELTVDGERVRGEHQRAWKQIVYAPKTPMTAGPHGVGVYVRDRAGLETRREMTVKWPETK